jgi:hypothetical protein
VSHFVTDPEDDDDAQGDEVEEIELGGPAVTVRRRRRLREGARPKVHSPRDLRREVFRKSLEARADEKVVRTLGLRDERPVVRGECAGGQRPCPWASCKHHLYLSVNPESGAITINFPDRELWEMTETCALDVAERGGITLEEVGMLTNVTRERVRQVETKALVQLRASSGQRGLR